MEQYEKPTARSLVGPSGAVGQEAVLACTSGVAVGTCNPNGITAGGCELAGFTAGQCSPTGNTVTNADCLATGNTAVQCQSGFAARVG